MRLAVLFLIYLLSFNINALTKAYKTYDCKTCDITDKFHNINQKSFILHSKLSKIIFKPLIVLNRLIPNKIKIIINRFCINLEFVLFRGLNAILQRDFRGFIIEARKFIINSSLGMGGLFDIAKKFKKKLKTKHCNKKYTFRHTLEKYGFKHKYYLFIPGLGPMSLITLLDVLLITNINKGISVLRSIYNINHARNQYKLIKKIKQTAIKMRINEYSLYKSGFTSIIKSQCNKCSKAVH